MSSKRSPFDRAAQRERQQETAATLAALRPEVEAEVLTIELPHDPAVTSSRSSEQRAPANTQQRA